MLGGCTLSWGFVCWAWGGVHCARGLRVVLGGRSCAGRLRAVLNSCVLCWKAV